MISWLNPETGLPDYSVNNIFPELFLIGLIYIILFAIILLILAVATGWGILTTPKLTIWATQCH